MKANPLRTVTLLGLFAAIGVFGLVALGFTALVGFEEPNDTLLLISSALVFAVPVLMLIHLSLTSALTMDEKRRWIREFTGARALTALSDYLTSGDRRATLQQRTVEAQRRRVRSA